MASENQSRAREKHILQVSNSVHKAYQESKEDITDTIGIVQGHAYGYQDALKKLQDKSDDDQVESDDNLNQIKLGEECEAIVKKQLQMLQADERGKQALQKEIADIKEQQQKRFDAILTRQRALEIEKDRSKKVASRPLLSRSIKSLLKQTEDKDSESRFNSELSQETAEEEDKENENKENMDEEYREQRRRLEEEWDKKAKKRFNDALKKERLKREHDDVFKEIEEAEKQHRLQKSRNLSQWAKITSDIPDRLQSSEKQAAMEDAVENVFRKSSTSKEHAIEDIEGYEDKWEAKYKQIDSNLESKMIDCVPSFVKENYNYLLGEEDVRPFRLRFSTLDDSNNELNMAYIESPNENANSSAEIAAVISHLDRLRSERDAEYENDFKPLLEAEASPKPESFDKAVETHILVQPTEDKATEVQSVASLENQASFASGGTEVDFNNAGVMSFKRRNLGSRFKNLSPSKLSTPKWIDPEGQNGESWTSSSYRSIPPNHGMPSLCRFCDSPNCSTPLVEDQNLHRDYVPLSKSNERSQHNAGVQVSDEVSPQNLGNVLNDIKSKLSSYVQIVADKYLKSSPTADADTSKRADDDKLSGETHGALKTRKSTSPNQRRFSLDSIKKTDLSKTSSSETSSEETQSESLSSALSDTAFELLRRKITNLSNQQFEGYPIQASSSKTGSDQEEDEFLQKGRDIIPNAILNLFSNDDSSTKSEDQENEYKSNRDVTPGHYVCHELSTIQEMDSVFTNDSLKKSSKSSSISLSLDIDYTSSDEIDTTSLSLLDVPLSEASLLARNIRFVGQQAVDSSQPDIKGTDKHKSSTKTLPESEADQAPDPQFTNIHETHSLPIVSGTQYSTQTPKSLTKSSIQMPSLVSVTGVSTPASMSLDDFLTPKEVRTEPQEPTTPRPDIQSGSKTPTSKAILYDNLSPQSVLGQGTPYSSSFYFPTSKHQHITNVGESLPEYFRDISSIRQASESRNVTPQKKTAPKLEPEGTRPRTVFPHDFNQQVETSEKSTDSFKPMTILPNSSRYSKKDDDSHFNQHFGTNEKTTDSFKPMTILPNSSRYSDKLGDLHLYQHVGTLERSTDSFKPMMILPNSSRYSEKDDHSAQGSVQQPKGVDERLSESSNNFKPMTPISYLSSLAESHQDNNHSTRSVQQNVVTHSENSPRRYKPRNGLSYLSSPSKVDPKQLHTVDSEQAQQSRRPLSIIAEASFQESNHRNESQPKSNDSSGSFKPMTPISYLSPPRSSSNEDFSSNRHQTNSQHRNRDEPEDSQNYPSLKTRLDLMPSKSNERHDFEDYHVAIGSQAAQELAMTNYFSQQSLHAKISDEQKIGAFGDKSAGGDGQTGLTQQNPVEESSSIFFVPKLPASFNGNPLPNKSKKVVSDSVISSSLSSNYLSSEAASSGSVSSGQSMLKAESSSNATSSSKDSSSLPSISSISSVSMPSSPNLILDALRKKILFTPSSTLSLCATPNSGCSSEVLSELSASKVTFQSTPVKSIESLIQETGILDEPDLTLLTTELTIKPESPVKPTPFPVQGSSVESGVFSNTNLASKLDSATTSSSRVCDSPSMMSFLEHEMSCLTPDSKMASPENIVLNADHSTCMHYQNDVAQRQCGRKGRGIDYKKRTKRLWNNLEEVKKRKELQERKEEMAKNRLKAKGYSKKFTPKKST